MVPANTTSPRPVKKPIFFALPASVRTHSSRMATVVPRSAASNSANPAASHRRPVQDHLARVPRHHHFEALLKFAVVETVRNHRRNVHTRLQQHAHLVPGLVHLPAVDA